MKSTFCSTALLAVFALGGVDAGVVYARQQEADNLIQKKALVCNADNALRAVRATQRGSVVTPFCQALLAVPTSTITETVTPSTLVSSTAIVTETSVYTDLVYSTHIYTAVIGKTSTVTITETVTVPRRKAKRTDVPIPSFLSAFPESRLSSACSCLDLPTPQTTVTATAAPVVDYDITTRSTVVSEPTTVTIDTTITTQQTSTVATVTATQLSSVKARPTAVGSPFYIKAKGGPYDGQFMMSIPFNGGNNRYFQVTRNVNDATRFKLATDGTISFMDKETDGNPAEEFGYTGFDRDYWTVNFYTRKWFTNCVANKLCDFVRMAINADDRIVGINSNGITDNRYCAGNRWALTTPTYVGQACDPIALYADWV
jgi:hypothetical protein